MRFEHDSYDVDVYSLCESVYYSCNNDEYDYVLECVNDWIYNDYNDNILLEDIILNEISQKFVQKAIQSKFEKLYPDLDFTKFNDAYSSQLSGKLRDLRIYATSLRNRQNREEKRRDLASGKTPRVYISGNDIDTSSLSPKEREKIIADLVAYDNRNKWFDVKKRDAYNAAFGKKGKHTENFRHKAMLFDPYSYKHILPFTIKYDPERDFDDFDDITPGTVPPKSNTPLEDKKGQPAQTPPKQNVQPNTPPTPPPPPNQEPPKSNTPLEDNKGKPAQTPSKQDTPVVTSNNNNQSRLFRATTWMKNNKVKGGLGVVAAGAAIGGSIYAYKRFKNRPKSVIAKRIQALRGIYHKFMINAQRNPQKANLFKRVAAKILSVIDKLLHYLQNKADGR